MKDIKGWFPGKKFRRVRYWNFCFRTWLAQRIAPWMRDEG